MPATTLYTRLRTYGRILTISVLHTLAYRARLTIWTITHGLSLLVFALIWGTVVGDESIAGFTTQDILVYYLGLFVLERVVRSHGWTNMSNDIRDGALSSWLHRPVRYLRYIGLRESGSKVIILLLLLPVLLLAVGVLIATDTWRGPERLGDLWWMLLFLIPSLSLNFSLSHVLGMITFWLEDNKGVVNAFWALTMIFSGIAAPVALLPGTLQTIATYLPFQYVAAFPVELYLGRVGEERLLEGFLVVCVWAFALHLLSRWLWRKGVKKYSAFGG